MYMWCTVICSMLAITCVSLKNESMSVRASKKTARK